MADPAPPMTLTIYRREGCAICDEAEELLNEELEARVAAGRSIPAVEHVDIATSEELEERYGPRIPVFELGDHELDLVVTPGRLRTLLDRAEGDGREARSAWT